MEIPQFLPKDVVEKALRTAARFPGVTHGISSAVIGAITSPSVLHALDISFHRENARVIRESGQWIVTADVLDGNADHLEKQKAPKRLLFSQRRQQVSNIILGVSMQSLYRRYV